jgi:hypothetical protein
MLSTGIPSPAPNFYYWAEGNFPLELPGQLQ